MNKEQSPFKKIRSSVAGALMAAVITGCSAFNAEDEITPTLQSPIPTISSSPAKEIPAKTYDQIIIEEVKRLGISLSDDERILWSTFGYAHAKEKVSINEITLQEAKERVQSTLTLMNQSENPYFRRAATFIVPFSELGALTFSIHKGELPNKLIKKAAMTTYMDIKEEKLHFAIAISSEEVINNSSSVTLAFQLAHEIKHLEDMVEYQMSLKFLSAEERLTKENERIGNPQALLQEEAQGFAIQAQAYIYAYGLGFRGGIGLSHEEYAAEFIKAGSNPNSPLWKNYIARNVLFMGNTE